MTGYPEIDIFKEIVSMTSYHSQKIHPSTSPHEDRESQKNPWKVCSGKSKETQEAHVDSRTLLAPHIHLRGSSSRKTLGDVIGIIDTPSQSNRTLLDIIVHDPYSTKKSNKTWKTFKHKIRRKPGRQTWTSSVRIPTSDVPIRYNSVRRMIYLQNSETPIPDSMDLESPPPDATSEGETRAEPVPAPTARPMMLRRESTRIIPGVFPANQKAAATAEEEDEKKEKENDGEEEGEQEDEDNEDEEEKGKPAVKMSLMALLAETDREMGLDGASYMMEDDEEEEEEEEDSGGGGDSTCCVCMVRHKGAGSVPCGHQYCRMCSRELYVQKSYCPLCNGFLVELLQVF